PCVARAHGSTAGASADGGDLPAADAWGVADTGSVVGRQTRRPVARAGQDWTSVCDLTTASVVLDATASADPDDQPLTYAWTRIDGPPVILDDAALALPSFAPPALPGGTTLTFRLEVNDGHVPSSATGLV